MTYKVLACGGREFKGRQRIYEALNQVHAGRPITHLIHGGAPGADTMAGQWAQGLGIQEVKCSANWGKHGRPAGLLRNARMAELQPDLVIAFPGGRGTAHMVETAQKAGLKVILVEGPGP